MSRQVKVGLFVILGVFLMMLAVFLIGDTSHMWETKTHYRAAFKDVGGLKPGSPVRMGGLDIGVVQSVGYDNNNLNDSRLYVRMAIVNAQAQRIRTDSVATIGNKGLLGDKMVEVTGGSPTAPPLSPSELIPSEEPADIFAAARKVAEVAQNAVEHLEPLVKSLGDPKLADDIKGSVSDVHAILESVVRGDGAMHRLFFDKTEGDRINDLIGRGDEAVARLNSVLTDVNEMAAQIRQGPGIAHALIYDGDLSSNASGSLAELHEDLRAIREGNGLAHAFIYGDSSSQHVMSNVNAMSDDLRAIVSGIREGKGTIGALLVDPTIYEDLKAAVGNVERNQVLRAFVRYSIKADEQRKGPEVNDHKQ
jgi:phospholipid/cholesterol/gamma-HCH transport system substrate-binding protein